MIRIAMLSFWHVHADGYARQAVEHPGTELVAAWDEDAGRGRERAAKLEVPYVESLPDLLGRDDVDAVIVDAPTNVHRDVLVAAADAGKHIFTEKLLALTLREATEIAAAVDRAGVRLTVSLPRLYDGYTQGIRRILDGGQLGDVTLVRTRLSHSGSLGRGWLPDHFYDPDQCGGGALVDLGAHPMYLARLFLGALPQSVTASFGYVTGRAVEDNAVATLHTATGALGVVEAGFVNRHSPFSIEVHGTEGSLFYGTPHAELHVRSALTGNDHEWTRVPVPEPIPSAFDQWVDRIGDAEDGAGAPGPEAERAADRARENLDLALDLTRLMEAATRSARSGRSVTLDSLAG